MVPVEPVLSDKARKVLVIILILVGVVLVGFFGFRTYQSFQRLEKRGLAPGTTDVEGIRGWMTIEYVASVFRVPSQYLFDSLEIPSLGNEKKSIRELGQIYFPEQPSLVMDKLKIAIQKYLQPTPGIPRAPDGVRMGHYPGMIWNRVQG